MCPLLQHRAPASPREAHSAQLAINLQRTYTQLLMSHSTECISLKGCEVRARWCEIDCYGCQAPSAHKHCTARSRMSISTMLQGTRVAWLRTSQTGSAECGTSRELAAEAFRRLMGVVKVALRAVVGTSAICLARRNTRLSHLGPYSINC